VPPRHRGPARAEGDRSHALPVARCGLSLDRRTGNLSTRWNTGARPRWCWRYSCSAAARQARSLAPFERPAAGSPAGEAAAAAPSPWACGAPAAIVRGAARLLPSARRIWAQRPPPSRPLTRPSRARPRLARTHLGNVEPSGGSSDRGCRAGCRPGGCPSGASPRPSRATTAAADRPRGCPSGLRGFLGSHGIARI
jgi:hypothetical protein